MKLNHENDGSAFFCAARLRSLKQAKKLHQGIKLQENADKHVVTRDKITVDSTAIGNKTAATGDKIAATGEKSDTTGDENL